MKRAEEIMIPLDKYPHVPYWSALREVVAVMERSEFEINGRKSLPRFVLVFDEQYKLLGIARRRDILRGLEPQFLAAESMQYRKKLFDVGVDPNLSELSYDKLIKGVKEQARRPVSDVMLPIKATVNHNDHVVKIIYEMVDTNVSLVPVIKEGRIVGVVRSVELFQEMAGLVL